MKPETLQFQNQEWVALRKSVLTLGLSVRPPEREAAVEIDIESTFVPPWVLAVDPAAPHDPYRRMKLELTGCLPAPGDWRALAGKVMEHVPMRVDVKKQKVARQGWSGPAVCLHSSGNGELHDHLPPERGKSRLVFGQWSRNAEGGAEIEYELEVFYPGPRAEREAMKRLRQRLTDFFAEAQESPAAHEALGAMFGPPPAMPVNEERLKEGWTLRHRGRVELQKVRCVVPLNVADAVGYARTMAARELGLTELGWCRVNGSESKDGSFRPEEGLCANGRLVLLSLP